MRPLLIVTENGNYYSPSDPGEPKLNERRLSVTNEECDILREYAEGKNVLEIGTGLGVSTKAMAFTAARVVSVDIDPWAHQFEFPDNVELRKSIPDEHFDLIFIDGSHFFEDVLSDIIHTKGDEYILHDCYLPGVAKAIATSGIKEIRRFNTRCDMRLFVK